MRLHLLLGTRGWEGRGHSFTIGCLDAGICCEEADLERVTSADGSSGSLLLWFKMSHDNSIYVNLCIALDIRMAHCKKSSGIEWSRPRVPRWQVGKWRRSLRKSTLMLSILLPLGPGVAWGFGKTEQKCSIIELNAPNCLSKERCEIAHVYKNKAPNSHSGQLQSFQKHF